MPIFNQHKTNKENYRPALEPMGTYKDPESLPNQLQKPIAHDKTVSTNYVDNEYVPLTSLITRVDGSPWKVNYYCQILGTHTPTEGLDVDMPAVYQQYNLIREFVIFVSTPLETEQNSDNNTHSMSGAGTIVYPTKPNVGDMFVAGIGDGREGIFKITNVKQKSFLKHSAFEVTYQLNTFTTTENKKNLDDKVVETYFFLLDAYDKGHNPIITSVDYKLVKTISKTYRNLIDYYFNAFYNSALSTLLIPAQYTLIYDPFITKFVKSVFDSSYNRKVLDLRLYNLGNDLRTTFPTVWDAILKRDPMIMNNCIHTCTTMSVKSFEWVGNLSSIRYSGIKHVIYPSFDIDNTNVEILKPKKITGAETVDTKNNFKSLYKPTKPPEYSDDIESEEHWNVSRYDSKEIGRGQLDFNNSQFWLTNHLKNNSIIANRIVKVDTLDDDHYIFTEAFYSGDFENMTLIEAAIWDYLNENFISYEVINRLVNDSYNWKPIELFYLTPVLLVLIKATMANL